MSLTVTATVITRVVLSRLRLYWVLDSQQNAQTYMGPSAEASRGDYATYAKLSLGVRIIVSERINFGTFHLKRTV
jgi:hypothetical protein